jgi:hypothetical protein
MNGSRRSRIRGQPLEIQDERTKFMNTSKQLLPRTILLGSLGLAAMLLVSTPSCKAQEVNPDHFTDTGVQDVYDGAPAKVATPIAKQNRSAAQVRRQQLNSPATVQTVAKRTYQLSAQLDTPAVADKPKPTSNTLPKQ